MPDDRELLSGISGDVLVKEPDPVKQRAFLFPRLVRIVILTPPAGGETAEIKIGKSFAKDGGQAPDVAARKAALPDERQDSRLTPRKGQLGGLQGAR